MNVLRVVTAVGAVAAGVVGFKALMGSKPQAKRKPIERQGALVEVLAVQPASQRLAVRARGLVKPARLVTMTPQVSGVVEALHPQLIEGGYIPADEVLVRIDDTDYRLQVAQARAQLEQARQSLEVEKARQAVAIREWKLMGAKAKNKARATRVPQIKMAEASVSAARNAVQQAGVNRKRTTLKAPFNAMVRTEAVDMGQLIGPQSRIAELVGTDAFWIEVLVPLRELPLIRLPEGDQPGSTAKVTVVNAGERPIERDGRVVRLLGELDPKSRMAKVIVEVKDPLGLTSKAPRLLLNSFVKVAIEGPQRDDLIAIPRIALREGDEVWQMTADKTLKVTPVNVVRRLTDQVLVKGLKPGTTIIKSRLASPVPGMALRLAETDAKVAAKAAPKSAP
jgi:RND family efflux transporter MFP subunit